MTHPFAWLGQGLLLVGVLVGTAPARAQQIDMSHGGPVQITASNGIEWHQAEQSVVAIGNAHAVRGDVTVVADRLIAFYRKKAGPPGTAQAGTTQAGTAQAGATQASAKPAAPPRPGALPGPTDEGGNEIYRLEALGHVHIFTATDQAECDKAVYDIDQALLVMTGHALKLTTPTDVITARDALEYWSQKRMAVARGDAVITTNDARQITADTVVAYMTDPAAQPAGPVTVKPPSASGDPLAASGKLQRAEIFGDVVIRTPTQTVRGDRGVYVPDTGIARLAGNTRLTQGQNQVNGSGLEVNLQTGIYRLISQPGQRVQGVMVPNDAGSGQPGQGVTDPANLGGPPAPGVAKAPAKPANRS